LYLKGTNWLTSVWPLMMRLSAAFTRREAPEAAGAEAVEGDITGLAVLMGAVAAAVVEVVVAAVVLNEDRSSKRSMDGPLGGKLGIAGCNAVLDESSQDNIEISNE
jgi:hypothetical protein